MAGSNVVVAVAADGPAEGGAPAPVAAVHPPAPQVGGITEQQKKQLACSLLGVGVLLILILVPASLEKVYSTEVGYAYDSVWAKLNHEQLTEGLKSIPPFGYIVKWPTSNQAVDLSCQCNSKDAIVVDIECDFLYVPMASRVLNLTLMYKDFEEYDQIVTMTARSSVRNSCGDFTALEFQTMRDSVQRDMATKVSNDLRLLLKAEVLTLNLRNIERPHKYQDAVNAREAARADIDLAIYQRKQQIVKANTQLQQASLTANKTINTAETLAAVKVAFAEAAYNATMDRYSTYARVLSHAQGQHKLSNKGVLAWHGNELAQESDHVAIDSASRFSYRDEL